MKRWFGDFDTADLIAVGGGSLLVLLLVVVLIVGLHEEIEHPCVRYEKRHSDFTVIAWDHKMRPIYGPGDVQECVERAP